jgi:putative pyruvate formate lyase activating enzyme
MLDNYFAILKGKLPARHHVAARIPAGVESLGGLPEDELWRLHAKAMSAFRKAYPSAQPAAAPACSLLDLKLALARTMLAACKMCERRCGVNREAGEVGFCGVGKVPRIASDFLHFGEERELVPSHTIFFSGCTFACVYCQNWDIAVDPRSGSPCDPRSLAASLLSGLEQGSRNANFVGGDPTPALPSIIGCLRELGDSGRGLPVIWNSNMYASQETMHLLEGVIDVYLGDFRYGNDACALEYSSAPTYFATVSRNFSLAHASAEVMLRQLLLPGHLSCCTLPIMRWASAHLPGVYFNLMFQYRPEYRASLYPKLGRRLSSEEKQEALDAARRLGLRLE